MTQIYQNSPRLYTCAVYFSCFCKNGNRNSGMNLKISTNLPFFSLFTGNTFLQKWKPSLYMKLSIRAPKYHWYEESFLLYLLQASPFSSLGHAHIKPGSQSCSTPAFTELRHPLWLQAEPAWLLRRKKKQLQKYLFKFLLWFFNFYLPFAFFLFHTPL